jgi:hypothetical protein
MLRFAGGVSVPRTTAVLTGPWALSVLPGAGALRSQTETTPCSTRSLGRQWWGLPAPFHLHIPCVSRRHESCAAIDPL